MFYLSNTAGVWITFWLQGPVPSCSWLHALLEKSRCWVSLVSVLQALSVAAGQDQLGTAGEPGNVAVFGPEQEGLQLPGDSFCLLGLVMLTSLIWTGICECLVSSWL